MDLHVCGKYGKLETMPDGILASSPALSRNVCSLCAAIATNPEDRCGAMRTIIQCERLQGKVQGILDPPMWDSSTQSLIKSENHLEKIVKVSTLLRLHAAQCP